MMILVIDTFLVVGGVCEVLEVVNGVIGCGVVVIEAVG